MTKKKLWKVLLGLCFISATFMGCQKDTEVKEESKAAFFEMNYRSFEICMDQAKEPYVCENEEDLQKFLEVNENNYILEDDYTKYTKTFDKKFFKKQDLIIVTDIENSGSHELCEAEVEILDDQQVNIKITRAVPEISTSDMAVWNIFVPVEKEMIPQDAIFTLEYNEKLMDE